MYKFFFKTTALVSLLAISLTACKKDETRVVANFSGAPVLTASASNIGILTRAGRRHVVVNYTWTPYTFTLSNKATINSPVVYTLQIAKTGTDFVAPIVEFAAGSDMASSLALTGSDLNTVLSSLGIATGQLAQVDVRLKTYVADNLPILYSATTSLTAAPYGVCVQPSDKWGIVGPAADGWPGATNTDRIMTYDCDTMAYVLTTPLTAGDMKFRLNDAWTVNLGGTVSATNLATGVPLTPGGANLTIPAAGTYTVRLFVNQTGTAVTGGTATLTK